MSRSLVQDADRRERMVERDLLTRGISDPRVLRAMLRVPRERFVPERLRHRAYADTPLPIGEGQTVSQPFIVAFMSQAADIHASDRCLEIGTGSGYQTAVLAELCAATFSIEYLPDVAEFARRNLSATGYLERNVELRLGDGRAGWVEQAPFDSILVTAAPKQVPQPLLDQLALGGTLVVPVGNAGGAQRLEQWTRVAAGSGPHALAHRPLLDVSFVPLLGPEGRVGR